MKWLHELSSDNYSILNIGIDTKNLVLKIEFNSTNDEKIQDDLIGEFQCSTPEELCEVYNQKIISIINTDCNISFNDFYGNELKPKNLKVYIDLENNSPSTTKLKKNEIFALDVLKEILVESGTDIVLENIVFYWNDEECECVYVNNKDLNNKDDKALEKYLKDNELGEWLNGTIVDVSPVSIDDIVEDYSDFLKAQQKVDVFMYKICAILEMNNCFKLVKTAPNFRAFSVWHDDDKVNFKLRKKTIEKLNEKN